MSMKDMIEKRNAERTAAEKIYKSAKSEKRAMKTSEADAMTKHYRNAKKFDSNLKALKAKRNADEATKNIKEVKRGEKSVNDKTRKEKELRALSSYLRSGSKASFRDLDPVTYSTDSTNNGMGITIPNTINPSIIQKLTESAPVFKAVRHLPTSTGTLSILRESDTDEAGFVGEGANVKEAGSHLSKITLNQKRLGAYSQLTNDILQDSELDLVNYTLGRLTWGFGKTVERSILLGKDKAGNKAFNPIIGAKGVKDLHFNGNLTVDNMLDLYDSINPAYLRNAMFVVSRPVFDQMIKLKDGNNQYLIFREAPSADNPGGFNFRGIPVYVSDVLDGAPSQIVMGDFNAGYGLMIKKGMNITQVIADTTQALAGGRLIVLSAYMDGAVINPDAFVTASIASGK